MKPGFFAALVCVFFCVPGMGLAQLTTTDGYIINKAGATEAGRLEYVNANLPGKRVFIPAGSKNVTLVSPETVNGYYINPEISFKTLPFKGKKVFMQVVSEGKLNLYNYQGNLFVMTAADSLVLLTGGPKTVTKDGKKYAIVDYSYKTQLRQALNAPGFDSQLNSLQFGEENISSLAREINGQPSVQSKAELKNVQQFEIRFGFTASAFTLQNIPYSQDSLNSNETFFGGMTNDPLPAEKVSLSSFALGGFYKKKIGAKYSYLKTGLVLNIAPEARKIQQRNFYKGFVVTNYGHYPEDTIGKAVDTYTYKMNTLEIPVSYYAELTDGRVRPFIDLGLVTRFYGAASVTLKREIYDRTKLLRTETGRMELPGLTVGPMLGLGCKYLLSENNALLFGINLDGWRSIQHTGPYPTSLQKSGGFKVYAAYGF